MYGIHNNVTRFGEMCLNAGNNFVPIGEQAKRVSIYKLWKSMIYIFIGMYSIVFSMVHPCERRRQ